MAFDPTVPYNDLPPLPPHAELETKVVLKKVASAGRSLAELKGLGATIPNQSILVNSLVLREAKASSEIENVVTTNDALFRAFTASSSQIDPATKEVLQYRTALWEGFKELRKRGLMTTNLFIKMVQTIVQNQAGIRVLPGTVIRNTKTRETLYTPPLGEGVIREKLKNLEDYIHGMDETDPLTKLAVIHYQFEAIHPFSDGNGRTGRIINSLYLVYKELLDLPVLYLSKHIIAKKSEYYTLLRAVTSEGEWENWTLYMLDAIETTAADTRDTIVAIRNLMVQTVESGKKNLPSRVYSRELIELLFHQPYTKAQMLVDAGIAERKTAAVYLRELEKIGILRSKRVGKEVLFLNVKLFRLLSK